jgi:hypothetical protein
VDTHHIFFLTAVPHAVALVVWAVVKIYRDNRRAAVEMYALHKQAEVSLAVIERGTPTSRARCAAAGGGHQERRWALPSISRPTEATTSGASSSEACPADPSHWRLAAGHGG